MSKKIDDLDDITIKINMTEVLRIQQECEHKNVKKRRTTTTFGALYFTRCECIDCGKVWYKP